MNKNQHLNASFTMFMTLMFGISVVPNIRFMLTYNLYAPCIHFAQFKAIANIISSILLVRVFVMFEYILDFLGLYEAFFASR